MGKTLPPSYNRVGKTNDVAPLTGPPRQQMRPREKLSVQSMQKIFVIIYSIDMVN